MSQFWRDLKSLFHRNDNDNEILIDLIGKSKVIIDYVRIINKYKK